MDSAWRKFRALPVWAQVVAWLVLAPFVATLFFWRSGMHFGKHVAVGFALVGAVSYAAMGAGGQAPVENPRALTSPSAEPTLQTRPSEVIPEYTPTPEAPKPTPKPTPKPSTPKPKPKPPVAKPKPKPKKPKSAPSTCHPSYKGACLRQNAGDYDCAGGSGNGPNYVEGPVQVVGYDEFDLDRDGNGWGCE